MISRTLVFLGFAAFAWPAAADAQIYAWRDASGQLVLSDRKLDGAATTYAVPDSPTIRATRPVADNDVRAEFEGLVQEHASRQRLRPDLVRAVIQVESGFNPAARSPKGAMGLMQLMPGTAADFGVLDPFNAFENIRGGVAYLRRLLTRYGNDERLALAAYNAGPVAVERHGLQVPPYRETQQYVQRILGARPSSPRSSSPPPAIVVPEPPKIIYKTIEMVDGHAVPRYSTSRPPSGPYEIFKLG